MVVRLRCPCHYRGWIPGSCDSLLVLRRVMGRHRSSRLNHSTASHPGILCAKLWRGPLSSSDPLQSITIRALWSGVLPRLTNCCVACVLTLRRRVASGLLLLLLLLLLSCAVAWRGTIWIESCCLIRPAMNGPGHPALCLACASTGRRLVWVLILIHSTQPRHV